MIIRSQDKRKTTTDLNLHISECDFAKDNITYRIYTSTHDWLGEYSTEEKAIKVLDMIEKEYRRTTDLDHEWKSSILFCVPRSNVFQMPQDSEV